MTDEDEEQRENLASLEYSTCAADELYSIAEYFSERCRKLEKQLAKLKKEKKK